MHEAEKLCISATRGSPCDFLSQLPVRVHRFPDFIGPLPLARHFMQSGDPTPTSGKNPRASMDTATAHKIQENPKFQAMIIRKKRMGRWLTCFMLVIYFGFILTIAFAPHWLALPLGSAGVITLGIPIGIGIILSAFAATGIYVYWANIHFDKIASEILKEAGH